MTNYKTILLIIIQVSNCISEPILISWVYASLSLISLNDSGSNWKFNISDD
jgi:hypothetical protein